jgi:hypothetical protein
VDDSSHRRQRSTVRPERHGDGGGRLRRKTVFFRHAVAGANWQTQGSARWTGSTSSGQRTRIFDAPADSYDEFVTALDDDYSQFIYTHESPTSCLTRGSERRHQRDHEADEQQRRRPEVTPRR